MGSTGDEEDAWQFKTADTSTTDIHALSRDQDTIAEVDHDNPKASEAIEVWREVRPRRGAEGRTKEARELHEFLVTMGLTSRSRALRLSTTNRARSRQRFLQNSCE